MRMIRTGRVSYDPATGNVVMFGGGSSALYGGTWAWDGSTWTQQHPAAHPPAMSYPAKAYDAATSNVVMFGGHGDGSHTAFSDTWIWG